MELGTRRAFVVVVLLGVAGTGLGVRLLSAAGHPGLGSALWVLGYGSTIAVLWYGWLRPLDLGSDRRPENTPDYPEAEGPDPSASDPD